MASLSAPAPAAPADDVERAMREVDAYNQTVKRLTTVHHFVGEKMDWDRVYDRPPPDVPQKRNRWAAVAAQDLEGFRPSSMQKLLGWERRIRSDLKHAIEVARERDEAAYQHERERYRVRLEQWKAMHELATAIRQGDRQAYLVAIKEFSPLFKMQEIGCDLEIALPDDRTAEVDVVVSSDAVVPRHSKRLLPKGGLQVREMTVSRREEIYQDYVCGCALRLARELFAFLPLSRAIVNVQAPVSEAGAGPARLLTVLSLGVSRERLKALRFEAIDPSATMKLFPHRMRFEWGQGFSAVTPLAPHEYPQ